MKVSGGTNSTIRSFGYWSTTTVDPWRHVTWDSSSDSYGGFSNVSAKSNTSLKHKQLQYQYPAVTFSYLHFRVGISWRESSHSIMFSISTCQDHSGMGLLRKSLPVSSGSQGLVIPKVPAMLRPVSIHSSRSNHTTWTLKVTCRLKTCVVQKQHYSTISSSFISKIYLLRII